MAKTLGSVLRSARERAGLSQSELSRRIDIAQPAICAWELNRSRPTAESLTTIARALRLDLGELALLSIRPLEAPRGTVLERTHERRTAPRQKH